jgi:hypothetical protein
MIDALNDESEPTEHSISEIKSVLGNILTYLKEGKLDTALEEIEAEDSNLIRPLKGLGIDIINSPSFQPIIRRTPVGESRVNLSGRTDEMETYLSIMEGTGTIPLTGSRYFLTRYSPTQETLQTVKETFGEEYLLELKKSLVLVFAEELAHTAQLRTENASDRSFVSKEMYHIKSGPPGEVRKTQVELDATLFLINNGYGSFIKDSLWLHTHENEYGITTQMAKWLGVKLSEETTEFVKFTHY